MNYLEFILQEYKDRPFTEKDEQIAQKIAQNITWQDFLKDVKATGKRDPKKNPYFESLFFHLLKEQPINWDSDTIKEIQNFSYTRNFFNSLDSSILFHCPRFQTQPLFWEIMLVSSRGYWGRDIPKDENEIKMALEQPHTVSYFYSYNVHTEQKDSLKKEKILHAQMTAWQEFKEKFAQNLPLFIKNYLLHNAIDNLDAEEVAFWTKQGALLNTEINNQNEILTRLFLKGEDHTDKKTFEESIDNRLKIYHHLQSVGLKSFSKEFFHNNEMDSFLMSQHLLKFMTLPEFKEVAFSEESVKFWILSLAEGWHPQPHPKKNPLQWALENGLSPHFNAGFKAAFSNQKKYTGSFLSNLKSAKVNVLLDLAEKNGFKFEDEIQSFKIIEQAIASRANDKSFFSLARMEANFITPFEQNHLLQTFFEQKRNQPVLLLQNLVGAVFQRHGGRGCQFFLEQTDKNGGNVMHWAAKNLHSQAMKFLYSQGLDIHKKDHKGNTPFHYAAKRYASGTEHELKEVMNFLNEVGFDWTIQNSQGKTGLMMMAKNGTIDNVLKALELNPALFSIQDNKGQSVIDVMNGRQQEDISLVEKTGLHLTLNTNEPTPSKIKRRI